MKSAHSILSVLYAFVACLFGVWGVFKAGEDFAGGNKFNEFVLCFICSGIFVLCSYFFGEKPTKRDIE
jgi:peptidoglycan/LPS O-acetylase OafA/YrhL